jgi:hypothetical protein
MLRIGTMKTAIRYYGKIVKVNFIDEGIAGKTSLYLVGNEFGPTDLICAFSESNAWEAWLDDQPAIDNHDLFMAYGFENPDAYNLACNMDDCDRKVYLKSLGLSEDFTLIEGYEYMPNFGNTNGVVDVGEYTWIREFKHIDK